MTIYISFINDPEGYKDKEKIISHDQIAYFIYKDLSKRFSNIVYHPFHKPIDLSGDDILVTCIPNKNITKWKDRTIIVDNDTFEVDKWKYGKFKKYGLDKNIDYTYCFNNYLEGLYGALIMTNDIAIMKLSNNHPDVLEKKNFIESNIKHFFCTPHPIDKKYFSENYNKDLKLLSPKMLVYYNGERKNAYELIEILKSDSFFNDKYDVVNLIERTTNIEYSKKYNYFAHVSLSESGPYLAYELLCQGIVTYGHEEWWDGYGYDILRYTYNPEENDRNISNLKKLLSNDFLEQYYLMRNDILLKYLSRTDNEWNYFNNILTNLIKGLL